jgi:hypothetical protein
MVVPLTHGTALFFKSKALFFDQEVQIIVPYFEILATLLSPFFLGKELDWFT